MTELLTAAQMRAIEQAAIESGQVTGLELMERAGQGVVDAIFAEWPELAETSHKAVVLCGPGNNGGDGFVVARLLKQRGWALEVFLYGDAAKLPPDAAETYRQWRELGPVVPLTAKAVAQGERPAVLIDAMFGTGLTRAIPLDCTRAYHAVENRDVGDASPCLTPYYRVAVDCASGLDCDSGQFLFPEGPGDVDEERHWAWWKTDASQRLLTPDLTVTFHRRKLGHYLTAPMIGAPRVIDIGLGAEPVLLRDTDHSAEVVRLLEGVETDDRVAIWPRHELDKRFGAPREHKYWHGHALILSGGAGHTGAARLAARGALRIGAGLVTVGSPHEALAEVAAQVTAVMCRGVDTAEALSELLEDKRINALCLGPGMGVNARTRLMLRTALAARRPMVLDADTLTVLAQEDDPFAYLHDACVLTPHAGEFARLFPDIAETLKGLNTKGPAYSKVDATRDAAMRAGCLVLFKGPDTVIAAPDGRCSLNAAMYDRAAPWLATAGSGDVLAGFITGLLARNLKPMEAVEIAAWLHTECARSFGPGLIAEDLPEQVPTVFRSLGL